jgi:hypothetical protein
LYCTNQETLRSLCPTVLVGEDILKFTIRVFARNIPHGEYYHLPNSMR